MNFALPLPPEQAHQLAARTIFSAKEIQGLYRRFKELDVSGNSILEYEECLAVDELRANPFAPRICELFSEDGSGSLTFTNFLDMKSAFSKKASPDVRIVWAFALWDFDGDDLIGVPDVKCGVDLITNSTTYINETALPLKEDDLLEMLDPYQLEEIAKQVILEIDPEGHGIDFEAFKGAVDKMPDFLFNFGMPT